jgi:hypothetical protein
MGLLSVLAVGPKEFKKFMDFVEGNPFPPMLLVGAAIGSVDAVIGSFDEESDRWHRDFLTAQGVSPGFVEPAPESVFQLHHCLLQPADGWTAKSLRAFIGEQRRTSEPGVLVFWGRGDLAVDRAANAKTFEKGRTACGNRQGLICRTDGYYAGAAFFPGVFSAQFDAVIHPLEACGCRVFAAPFVTFCANDRLICADEATEKTQEKIHFLARVETGKKADAKKLLERTFGIEADVLRATHGWVDLVSSKVFEVRPRTYMKAVFEVLQKTNFFIKTRAFAVTQPPERGDRKKDSSGYAGPAVNPLWLPERIAGRDASLRVAKVRQVGAAIFQAVQPLMRGGKPPELRLRFIPGERQGYAVPVAMTKNETILEAAITYGALHPEDDGHGHRNKTDDRKYLVYALYEIVEAACRALLLPLQRPLAKAHQLHKFPQTPVKIIDDIWENLGESLGACVSLSYLRHHPDRGGRPPLRRLASLILDPAQRIDPSIVAKFVAGRFLQRVMALRRAGAEEDWTRAYLGAADDVAREFPEFAKQTRKIKLTKLALNLQQTFTAGLDFLRFEFSDQDPANSEDGLYVRRGETGAPKHEEAVGAVLSMAWSLAVDLALDIEDLIGRDFQPAPGGGRGGRRPAAVSAKQLRRMYGIILCPILSIQAARLTDRVRAERVHDAIFKYVRAKWKSQAAEAGFADLQRYAAAETEMHRQAHPELSFYLACRESNFEQIEPGKDRPTPAGCELLAEFFAAGDGGKRGVPVQALSSGDPAAGAIRYDLAHKLIVKRRVEQPPELYLHRNLLIARAMQLELNCLKAAWLTVSARGWRPNGRYVSFNINGFLLDESLVDETTDPAERQRLARFFTEYREEFVRCARRLCRAIRGKKALPVIEIKEGRVPKKRAGEGVSPAWRRFWAALETAASGGKAGIGLDDSLGPGADLPRLHDLVAEADNRRFARIFIKVDGTAIAKLLYRNEREAAEGLPAHEPPPPHWALSFANLQELTCVACDIREDNREKFALVFEGATGFFRDEGKRARHIQAFETALRQMPRRVAQMPVPAIILKQGY